MRAKAGVPRACVPATALLPDGRRRAVQVAKEIWVCDKKAVGPWKGTIREYKDHLARKMGVAH